MDNINKQRRDDALDAQIDSALNALREAVPPGGLHARVLHRARRAAHPSRHSSALPWKFAAAICVMVVTATIAIEHRNDPSRRSEAAQILRAQSGPVAKGKHPPSLQALPHESPVASNQHQLGFAPTRSQPPVKSGRQRLAPAEEVAYAEMNAPSKPAPEMPLTKQEKLLLRVAHRADTSSQVAELRRPVWPLRDPDQDDNFEQFFQKPAQIQHGDAE